MVVRDNTFSMSSAEGSEIAINRDRQRNSRIKKTRFSAGFLHLARPERFERPTAWFVARYSIQLSYGREGPLLCQHLLRSQFLFNPLTYAGGEGGIRTLDTLLAYTPLAGEPLRPLGHLSFAAADMLPNRCEIAS